MSAEQDLAQGFPDYEKPPKDIVPKQKKDHPPLPTGIQTVTYYDVTTDADGWVPIAVSRHQKNITITEPYTGPAAKEDDNQ